MSTRAMSWAVVIVLVAAVLLTGGCPKKVQQAAQAVKVAQDAQDGNYTVKNEKGEEVKVETKGANGDEGGSVTVTGPKGEKSTYESGANAVKQEDVGIDFYPGATVDSGSKASKEGEGGGTYAQVSLSTKDAYDKVTSFYKGKYAKGNTVMDSPDNCMIMFNEGEHKGASIIITPDKESGTTTIAIVTGSGG